MDNRVRAQLRDTLADLYSDPDRIQQIVQDSGLALRYIDFKGSAQVVWGRIIDEAEKRSKLKDLLTVVTDAQEYGANLALQEAIRACYTTPVDLQQQLNQNRQASARHSVKTSLLPALINRDLQIEPVRNAFLQPTQQPKVYVLYGLEEDMHELFLRRVKESEIAQLAEAGKIDAGLRRLELNWQALSPNPQRLQEQICQQIMWNLSKEWPSSAATPDGFAQLQAINAHMNEQLRAPYLIQTWIPIETWDGYQDQKIRDFVHFWIQWSALEQPYPLLLVFLCIRVNSPPVWRSLWQRLVRAGELRTHIDSAKIKQFFAALDPSGKTCVVLEPMPLVTLYDLEVWIRYAKEIAELPQLAKAAQAYHDQQRSSQKGWPMKVIAMVLEALIEKQSDSVDKKG